MLYSCSIFIPLQFRYEQTRGEFIKHLDRSLDYSMGGGGRGSNSSMITVLFRKFNPPRNGSLLENFGNFGYGLCVK